MFDGEILGLLSIARQMAQKQALDAPNGSDERRAFAVAYDVVDAAIMSLGLVFHHELGLVFTVDTTGVSGPPKAAATDAPTEEAPTE